MSVLQQILEHKRTEVEKAKSVRSIEELRAACLDAPLPRGFLSALKSKARPVALIAEVKRTSPSRKETLRDIDPVGLAKTYEEAGAACISVLTDAEYFGGSLADLRSVAAVTTVPVLRKEFVIDPYQVAESRAAGADAILLIVAALEPDQLRSLHDLASELGMDVLVEAHTESEALVAMEIGANLVGINNRDLGTLQIDLNTGVQLIPTAAKHAFAVAESGIETHADVSKLADAGARGVLIGSVFCDAANPGEKVREVMGW